MDIQIREAVLEDAMALARLNQVVHNPHVEVHPNRYKSIDTHDEQLIATYEKFINDDKAFIFIATDAETPIGYLMGFMRQQAENPFVFSLREFHIDQMAVDLAYQRQGIGHLLMEKALELARKSNVDFVSLGVAAFNHSVIDFYKKHGFTIRALQMWQQM